MAQTIESLLRESAAAAAAGDTRKSWELISSYATDFWLVDESEIPADLVGDFYPVRAAAADWLGLEDEAVAALQAMERWAKENNNHEVALVAAAHLAYQSLNQPDHAVFLLPDAASLLSQVAERFTQWRPDPDSPSIGEDESISWKSVTKRQAAALTTAAATAHTVATNLVSTTPLATHSATASSTVAPPSTASSDRPAAGIESTTGGDVDVPGLVEFFSSMVWRFGKNPANKMDELLWFAQDHWSQGRREQARETAAQVVEIADKPAPKYEAHFMLGHFAMLEILDAAEVAGLLDVPTKTIEPDLNSDNSLDRQVAFHWSECAELAIVMGAPVMALERAELACRMLSSLGREGEAWSLASRMVTATEGIPVCPALLNIRAMLAQAAFVAGLHQEAWDNACPIAEWSEFTPDVQRTNACYTIATFAGLELGLDEEVLHIQERRAALFEQAGEYINASQVLQSIAIAGNLEFEEAQDLMRRAWELLHREPEQETLLWNRAEWHLTMTNIVLTEEDVVVHASRAAEEFHQATDPIKEASAWLTMAGGLIAQHQADEADRAILRATAALPDLDAWIHDEDEDFDPVISELIDHYRYILDFRRSG